MYTVWGPQMAERRVGLHSFMPHGELNGAVRCFRVSSKFKYIPSKSESKFKDRMYFSAEGQMRFVRFTSLMASMGLIRRRTAFLHQGGSLSLSTLSGSRVKGGITSSVISSFIWVILLVIACKTKVLIAPRLPGAILTGTPLGCHIGIVPRTVVLRLHDYSELFISAWNVVILEGEFVQRALTIGMLNFCGLKVALALNLVSLHCCLVASF
eukprot:Gb_11006 [translate_table: standard]